MLVKMALTHSATSRSSFWQKLATLQAGLEILANARLVSIVLTSAFR
jgi:hypothetical protein